MTLFLAIFTLTLLMGVTCFAGAKMTKALKDGKIYFGPKGSTEWRDIDREHEPFRFWEAMFMHAMLGALGFGGTAWMLFKLPEIFGKLL